MIFRPNVCACVHTARAGCKAARRVTAVRVISLRLRRTQVTHRSAVLRVKPPTRWPHRYISKGRGVGVPVRPSFHPRPHREFGVKARSPSRPVPATERDGSGTRRTGPSNRKEPFSKGAPRCVIPATPSRDTQGRRGDSGLPEARDAAEKWDRVSFRGDDSVLKCVGCWSLRCVESVLRTLFWGCLPDLAPWHMSCIWLQ